MLRACSAHQYRKLYMYHILNYLPLVQIFQQYQSISIIQCKYLFFIICGPSNVISMGPDGICDFLGLSCPGSAEKNIYNN